MFTTDTTTYTEYHLQSKNINLLKHYKNDHLNHYKEDNLIFSREQDVTFSKEREAINLPEAKKLNISFHDLMERRTSQRDFNAYPIMQSEIATLLQYACGYKDSYKNKKYVPSSGNFQSVNIFPIVLNSKEIEKGIYYYDYKKHKLLCLKKGDYRIWLEEEIFFQKEWGSASVIFVLTSDTERLSKKYWQRAYRLSLLDVGHISQMLYVTGAALNLKVCACGGYVDQKIDEAIGIDGVKTSSFLTVIIGK